MADVPLGPVEKMTDALGSAWTYEPFGPLDETGTALHTWTRGPLTVQLFLEPGHDPEWSILLDPPEAGSTGELACVDVDAVVRTAHLFRQAVNVAAGRPRCHTEDPMVDCHRPLYHLRTGDLAP